MAQRAILEWDAKRIISERWHDYFGDEFSFEFQSIRIDSPKDLETAAKSAKWVSKERLVVKPDMLFGERGKNDLVCITKEPGKKGVDEAITWMTEKSKCETTLKNGTSGRLSRFIVEPFFKHDSDAEFYVSASTEDDHDVIHMSAYGGVNIMSDWEKVVTVDVPIDKGQKSIDKLITEHVPKEVKDKERFAKFVSAFYRAFKDMHFTYLEFNPFLLVGNTVYLLDAVAKVDDTAGYLMTEQWGDLEYHSSFGQAEPSDEEKMIKKMDEDSGASLKLTLLNLEGRVWTLVAGGGASVVYADTIANTWGVNELANYGEYSGNPSESETYVYAKTVIDLMTREKDKHGREKVLLIGGAIANFTDVAKTFNGIIKAFEEMADKMKDVGVRIYVRRGGPNYELGLRNIRTAAKKLKLPIEVYGPVTHLTDIVRISYDDVKN